MLRRPQHPRQTRGGRCVFKALSVLLPLIFLAGCTRFQKVTHTYVYVAARQVYLRDRVAAVSNRVVLVTNGQTLEVLERGKRFLKVKTAKGEIGWLEEHAIIDDKDYAAFEDLAKKHKDDPVVVRATLRDDLYLHIGPGRDAQHFLLIPGNTKVDLLARGTIAKGSGPGSPPPAKPKPPIAPPNADGTKKVSAPPAASTLKPPINSPAPATPAPIPAAAATLAPIPMEDWWLVRDSAGHTGWLLAGRLDVDIPEEVGGYGEGSRFVGAYVIAKVMDSGVERKAEKKSKNGKPAKPVKAEPIEEAPATPVPTEHPEYVTVLSPNKGGLPYDFDQVRVFTWSLNHHRYETGFRMRGIQGYLPVVLGQETVNGQSMPTFSFQIASGPNVSIDPETGVTRPVAPRTIVFRLEGNLVRRTGADQLPIVAMHDATDPNAPKTAKQKAATKKKKR